MVGKRGAAAVDSDDDDDDGDVPGALRGENLMFHRDGKKDPFLT